MQEKEYILRVQDLKTDFKVGRKTVHAVHGVTFDVQRGKTLCACARADAERCSLPGRGWRK